MHRSACTYGSTLFIASLQFTHMLKQPDLRVPWVASCLDISVPLLHTHV